MKIKTNLKGGFDVEPFTVEVGPIWNDEDASWKCPRACEYYGLKANGEWVTTIPNQESVCTCVH